VADVIPGERLERVRNDVREAAERSGRDPDAVEILPVTKGHPASVVRAVAETDLGRVAENRVGEAEEKLEEVGRLGLEWHMVGHLQRNKAARAVQVFDVIESVDSRRLARKLDREARKAGREHLEVLCQVNTSGEESKGGFPVAEDEEEALAGVAEVCEQERLHVRGLMTMAPLTDEESVLRETFRVCRRFGRRCGQEIVGFESDVLSMGMSNDFEIAVEEGSTRLRLGTALLGERP